MILTATAIDRWQTWLQRDFSPTTARTFATIVGAFVTDMQLSDRRVHTINDDLVHKWVNKEDDAKLSSKRYRLTALRNFFKYCANKGHTTGNPANLVKVRVKGLKIDQLEKQERRPFTDAEVTRILNHLEERIMECWASNAKLTRDRIPRLLFWWVAVNLGRKTGLRLGDVAQLQWDSIKPGILIVWTDKTDTRVALKIDREIEAVLSFIPKTDERYCFPVENSVLNSDKRCVLSKQFERILEACDIHGVSFHCLRHAYATACDAAGIPTPHISKALGHASEAMTRRYIHE